MNVPLFFEIDPHLYSFYPTLAISMLVRQPNTYFKHFTSMLCYEPTLEVHICCFLHSQLDFFGCIIQADKYGPEENLLHTRFILGSANMLTQLAAIVHFREQGSHLGDGDRFHLVDFREGVNDELDLIICLEVGLHLLSNFVLAERHTCT